MAEGSDVRLPVPLSASKLKTADRCPEAFRLGYLTGLPEEGGESRWIRRGNAVHEAIEGTLRGFDAEWDPDYLRHKFRRAYRQNGWRGGYDLGDEDHDHVLDCLDTAARWCASKAPTIVGIESEIPFDTDAVDHPHGFSGFVDVATETEIWDWKTGTSDDKEDGEILQGAVYMCGYYAHMGRLPEQVHFLYLAEDFKRSYDPSADLYETMVDHATDLLGMIDSNILPAKAPEPCYHCDYEVHCGASPVGGGGIDWEAYP